MVEIIKPANTINKSDPYPFSGGEKNTDKEAQIWERLFEKYKGYKQEDLIILAKAIVDQATMFVMKKDTTGEDMVNRRQIYTETRKSINKSSDQSNLNEDSITLIKQMRGLIFRKHQVSELRKKIFGYNFELAEQYCDDVLLIVFNTKAKVYLYNHLEENKINNN